jgi:DNA-binding GntR family transcriptional regulator
VSATPGEAVADGPRPGSRDNTLVIHRLIREEILSGDLAAGTWISQVQLARRFGVSRGPVREALRLLEREGLIAAAVNQRARIAEFSIHDLEQLYAARIVTEGLGIAASVPLFTDDDIAGIRDLIGRLDAFADVDMAAWEAVHRRFHTELVKYAGDRLLRMMDQFYDHAERYRRVYITGDPRAWWVGATEHRQIAEACAARDASGAAVQLARHLSRTALTALALIAPEHEPALVRTAVRQVAGPSTGC